MKKPFKLPGRKGWHGEIIHADGRAERRHFALKRDAGRWQTDESAKLQSAQAPLFGGPSGIVLGRMLGEYAGRFTINKCGYVAELNRINHYVMAAGLPRLRIAKDTEGKLDLTTLERKELPKVPKGFAEHLDNRLGKRVRSSRLLEELACKKVSKITTDDIQCFYTEMKKEGLSASTIQKEIALLKAAFNSAISIWKWEDFKNPCIGVKLGSSKRRFVVLTSDDERRLYEAISECDNPLVWPFVALANVSTLRKGTLLCMTCVIVRHIGAISFSAYRSQQIFGI